MITKNLIELYKNNFVFELSTVHSVDEENRSSTDLQQVFVVPCLGLQPMTELYLLRAQDPCTIN